MAPERREQVNELYHAPLEREPNQRADFLNQTCADDAELRTEVERLIASHEQAGTFMETPTVQVPDKLIAEAEGRSLTGRLIGSYEILAPLGKGAMGEVYLVVRFISIAI